MRFSLPLPKLFIGLCLFLATLAIYGRTVSYGYIGGDNAIHIYRNRNFINRPVPNYQAIWTRPYYGYFAPITYSLWGGVFQLSEKNRKGEPLPWTFHLANSVVHSMNVCLVFFIALQLGVGALAAAFGALFFAFHPMQVEPVAWISSMKDLLYVFWGLLAILSAIKPPRKGELIQTSLFFVLSLLSKPQAVAIPFMIFLLRISFLKLPVKSEARRLLGFFCLSLPIVILTKVRQLGIGIEPLVPFYQRPLLVLDSSVFYLKKLIWPADLIYTYSRTPSYVANDYGLAWRNLFFAGLFGSGVWLLRKRINLGLWLLLFFLPLAPVLGFLFFSFQEYSTVADRFAYLSFLAPSLLLATLYPRIPSRFSVFLWLLTPALIFLTQRQLPLWANERGLLERRSEIFDLETKQEKTFQLLISELAAGPPTLQQIQNLSKYTAEWARLDPFSPLPQWVHGSILLQLGDRKRADGFIQRAKSFSPLP